MSGFFFFTTLYSLTSLLTLFFLNSRSILFSRSRFYHCSWPMVMLIDISAAFRWKESPPHAYILYLTLLVHISNQDIYYMTYCIPS
ncbi:hypothetical protein BJY04DRAFT_109628 [Aspergillus karnatakaensis]|uniref:uncharacterized protein n=1 Tax=Aspergillus karnatakaensis TaxID=1810916 RepID=UPI003CCCD61C